MTVELTKTKLSNLFERVLYTKFSNTSTRKENLYHKNQYGLLNSQSTLQSTVESRLEFWTLFYQKYCLSIKIDIDEVNVMRDEGLPGLPSLTQKRVLPDFSPTAVPEFDRPCTVRTLHSAYPPSAALSHYQTREISRCIAQQH